MEPKRKYPKSFYDDGLGEILEWIDDEVLANSELKAERQRAKSKKCKKETKPSLYGDNDVVNLERKPKKVKFDAPIEAETNLDKKLEDRTRGLINRLAAQTMPFVTSEFEKLYSINSRSSVNTAIFNNIESSIVCQHAIVKRKLVAELMLLVSYLDFKISHNIGATLVHRLVNKFEELYNAPDQDDHDKRLENIVLCLLNLYIIGLISANVIFEITDRICSKNFRPKSVELILIVLKGAGFQLRKDVPQSMRQLIVSAQDNCKELKSNSEINKRIEFMMEALVAVKNNNMTKLGNYGCDLDKDTIESTLKNLIKRSKLSETLSDASYEEILASPNWHLLETRVDDNENRSNEKSQSSKSEISTETEIKLCKALGLNKPAERTIFSALLKVSDYVEASNVIIGFGMNQCSNAMLVCVHVAIHEKSYNQFYFNVINNLCKYNRKYKMATKFSIQDKIRVLGKMSSQRVDVFKQLCLDLIKSDAIPITILKAIEWADIQKSTKDYLNFLLDAISSMPDEEKRKIMVKVDKKSSFAGAMRTFINCFMKGCKLFQ